MSKTSFGSALRVATADQQSVLGARRVSDDHSKEYVYIKNATGGTIPAKRIVMTTGEPREASGGPGTVAVLASRVLGVTLVDIPAGYFGWVQRRGNATIKANGTVTATQLAQAAASGDVSSVATVGAGLAVTVIGHAVATVATTLDATIFLNLP